VDIGLHDGGVHAQPAASHDLLFLRDGHHALMNLLDDLRAQDDPQLAQRLGVGNLLRAHARELAIYQVRTHFALEHRIAPVAHVLEHQQSQHDLRRGSLAPARAAVRPAAGQRRVHQIDQLRVPKHVVDMAHPVFPQLAHFLSDQALGQIELQAAQFNHIKPSRAPWPAAP
jgi:hypothetical protein